MLLPIRTSIRPWRTPYMNYALIIINVIIFLLSFNFGQKTLQKWANIYMLTPAYPILWQFVTYAFLHGGPWHIFWNMFFLYLFGNNVNDRLGHIGYLGFYLAGAVFSALGHILAASLYGAGAATPVLGASGAVAAVIGAYMVLFPQTLITVVYWFFFIGTLEVPAIYLIIVKMIFIDNVISRSAPNVAYDAHLSGYAFGVLAILLLRVLNLIHEDQLDLWTMLKQWNRRRVYKDVVAEGVDSFAGRISKKIEVKEVKTEAQKQAEEKISSMRQEIMTRISGGNIAAAADLYLELTKENVAQPLPRQPLLDIANQLMSAGKWPEAAGAYEKFLSFYGGNEYSGQIQLMLGIIYTRYLPDKIKALDNLKKAFVKLAETGQKKMCQDEIKRLEA
ncbi:MAG: rhomboid family intramembrane serine protease [Planctomycetes bacterium]|nr:rhomboid family intramembrane serine protease [Planctomycetota bacterium]MBU2457216.1 rhomboid family intramembrane serine protease [Planctomycetota bacterium]